MKFIIYCYFYISSTVNINVSTVVYIHGDTISSYYYDFGYIDWKIVKREKEIINTVGDLHAIYILEHIQHRDIKSTMFISGRKIHQTIMTKGRVEYITLKRRKYVNYRQTRP